MSDNLCDTCLFHCGDITSSTICDKYIERKYSTRYYYDKRDHVPEVNP